MRSRVSIFLNYFTHNSQRNEDTEHRIFRPFVWIHLQRKKMSHRARKRRESYWVASLEIRVATPYLIRFPYLSAKRLALSFSLASRTSAFSYPARSPSIRHYRYIHTHRMCIKAARASSILLSYIIRPSTLLSKPSRDKVNLEWRDRIFVGEQCVWANVRAVVLVYRHTIVKEHKERSFFLAFTLTNRPTDEDKTCRAHISPKDRVFCSRIFILFFGHWGSNFK